MKLLIKDIEKDGYQVWFDTCCCREGIVIAANKEKVTLDNWDLQQDT